MGFAHNVSKTGYDKDRPMDNPMTAKAINNPRAVEPNSRQNPYPGFALALWLLFLLLSLALAQPQPNPESYGYVEGRIIEMNALSARVQLADGQIVEADLGVTLPEDRGGSSLPTFKVGQQVELYYSPSPDSARHYVVSDWVRRPALLWLTALFLLVSVAVARYKGLRAFIATGASLFIVIAFIIPRILDGWNPVLVSLLGVGGILILAIYFVHGLNWSTTAALIGTYVSVFATIGLGMAFTEWAHLTGFGSEDAMMISFGAQQINLKGLLLAGLLIGALGALEDITIVQASIIRELAHINPNFSLWELYRHGMNIGNDHIGSLVNTLVLAYTGAALPLLLLLSLNEFSLQRALNIELVASEVVHTLVGSIGLVLAVPLSTFVAAFMFRGDKLPMVKGELDHAHHPH
jgi:uncharacterized membrane protein